MLKTLVIRNIVLVEEAELTFESGLNVLTGETGAGKSILLDSVGFVLGWRTRGSLVRSGAGTGEVTAEFLISPGHPVASILEEAGIPGGDILLLRRIETEEGRRQAWANDQRVTVETLHRLGRELVEFQGQQDDRGLLNPSAHRTLLDEFAQNAEPLTKARATWKALKDLQHELTELRSRRDSAAREAEFLSHSVEELLELNPVSDEEPKLDERRSQLRSAEQIREDVAKAMAALGGDGAEGSLLQAIRWLESASGRSEGGMDASLEGLSQVLAGLDDVKRETESLFEGLAGEPGELDAVEERLFAIRGLARKHQVSADQLPELMDEMQTRLQELDRDTSRSEELELSVGVARKRFSETCAILSVRRKNAAVLLDAAIVKELKPLKMDRAVFRTEIEAADPGPEGADRVRFTASTNPGSPAGPIDRVASGGELSRFLLALKVCLSAGVNNVTLIFDEIDRGVGGATADAVGKRLEALGQTSQVLAVTHSPQVAARGRHHWHVGKTFRGEELRTEVALLSEDGRTDEVARMLAGDRITAEARAAAKSLLDER